jgi:hypothetical protein
VLVLSFEEVWRSASSVGLVRMAEEAKVDTMSALVRMLARITAKTKLEELAEEDLEKVMMEFCLDPLVRWLRKPPKA